VTGLIKNKPIQDLNIDFCNSIFENVMNQKIRINCVPPVGTGFYSDVVSMLFYIHTTQFTNKLPQMILSFIVFRNDRVET